MFVMVEVLWLEFKLELDEELGEIRVGGGVGFGVGVEVVVGLGVVVDQRNKHAPRMNERN